MKARNPNVGRHAMGSNPAPGSTFKPPKQGAKDSGGKIFNPDQKAKSNVTSTPLGVVNNSPNYPAMNTAAAGNPLGVPGSGKVTKKVAVAKQSFYGR